MSVANRDPELLNSAPPVHPTFPSPDTMEDILVDFLAWIRSEKGLRICTKEGTDGQGRSVYEYAYRAAQVEAATDFVANMGVAPYRPPAPLVAATSSISAYVNGHGDEIRVDDLPF